MTKLIFSKLVHRAMFLNLILADWLQVWAQHLHDLSQEVYWTRADIERNAHTRVFLAATEQAEREVQIEQETLEAVREIVRRQQRRTQAAISGKAARILDLAR